MGFHLERSTSVRSTAADLAMDRLGSPATLLEQLYSLRTFVSSKSVVGETYSEYS